MGPAAPVGVLAQHFAYQGGLLLDGGLATELEFRGHELSTDLWSAQLVRTAPGAITAVHRDYLDAGADCITAATYQASFPGLEGAGLDRAQAEDLFRRAVVLALEAREDFPVEAGRPRPLVAASVGPYGAFLADGSEYRGHYGLDSSDLRAFHRDRWSVLAESGADLLACETLPCALEVRVLLELCARTPGRPVWLSVACRDGGHLVDGSPIEETAALVADVEGVVAFGVNCTAPGYLPELLERITTRLSDLPLVVYPNSGESYDGARGSWSGDPSGEGLVTDARSWWAGGARLIGGCCRTRPSHVAALRAALFPESRRRTP